MKNVHRLEGVIYSGKIISKEVEAELTVGHVCYITAVVIAPLLWTHTLCKHAHKVIEHAAIVIGIA